MPLPIMLECELTEDMELLAGGPAHPDQPGLWWIAIHDHSKSYGEVEIFESLLVLHADVRFMWE